MVSVLVSLLPGEVIVRSHTQAQDNVNTLAPDRGLGKFPILLRHAREGMGGVGRLAGQIPSQHLRILLRAGITLQRKYQRIFLHSANSF